MSFNFKNKYRKGTDVRKIRQYVLDRRKMYADGDTEYSEGYRDACEDILNFIHIHAKRGQL